MLITQRVQALGNFSGELVPGAADSVARFVTEGSEIVITANRWDMFNLSDANILSAAIYVAYITNKPSPTSFQGYDLGMFLGTPGGRGDLLDTAINATNVAWTLAQWVTALLPASLTSGTIRVGGATWTGPPGGYRFMSRREALTDVCTKLSAEWRVNPAGTFDADTVSVLYPTSTTPTVVVTDKEEGQDGTLRGLQGTVLISGVDIEDYTTSAIVVGQGSGTTVITAAANSGATTYKDHLGANLVMEQFVNSPSDSSTTAANTATAELAKGSSARRQLSVQSNTYAVTRFAKHGDYVYAYNLSANLIDAANQITYRGELLPVIKLRCFGLTWPVQRGMGVYCRKWVAGVATYLDLTDQWAYETGDTTWDVGQVPMIFSSPTSPSVSPAGGTNSAGAARLGVNPAIVARVSDTSTNTQYTSTLTAAAVNPNIGATGTAVGYYTLVNGWCHWEAVIQSLGAGAAAGTGQYSITLPIAPIRAGSFTIVGHGWFFNGTFHGVQLDASTGGTGCRITLPLAGILTSANPAGGFAVGAVLSVAGSYRYL